jgi:hypothetical protein
MFDLHIIGATKVARILEMFMDHFHIIPVNGVWSKFNLAIVKTLNAYYAGQTKLVKRTQGKIQRVASR